MEDEALAAGNAGVMLVGQDPDRSAEEVLQQAAKSAGDSDAVARGVRLRRRRCGDAEPQHVEAPVSLEAEAPASTAAEAKEAAGVRADRRPLRAPCIFDKETGHGDAELSQSRQVRAVYSEKTVRVYQAYNNEIAEAALRHQHFVHPWSPGRMTWVKPSAAWMGYRCGWSRKDKNQSRVLAVDLHREVFDLLLVEARLASQQYGRCDVVVQWDPERGLGGSGGKSAWTHALSIRSLQMGIRGEMTKRFASKEFIAGITDVTKDFQEIGERLKIGDVEGAAALLPTEEVYPLPAGLAILSKRALYSSEQD